MEVAMDKKTLSLLKGDGDQGCRDFVKAFLLHFEEVEDVNDEMAAFVAQARRLAGETLEGLKTAIENAKFDQWAWTRLADLVRAGRDDLRMLRNRFALSASTKLPKGSEITAKERKDARYLIETAHRERG